MSEATGITTSESESLVELESKIEAGLKTFFEVGKALLKIRDGKLYREKYSTFEEYCEKRWGFKKSRAYQLMGSAQVFGALESSTIVDVLPENEAQARPLAKLEDDDEKRAAWQRAVETAPGGTLTAAHVESVVSAKIVTGPNGEKYSTQPVPANRRKDEAVAAVRAVHQPELDEITERLNAARRAEKAARNGTAETIQALAKQTAEIEQEYAAAKRRVNGTAATYAQATAAEGTDEPAPLVTPHAFRRDIVPLSKVLAESAARQDEPHAGEGAGAEPGIVAESSATYGKEKLGRDNERLAASTVANLAYWPKAQYDDLSGDGQYVYLQSCIEVLDFTVRLFSASHLFSMPVDKRVALHDLLKAQYDDLRGLIEKLKPQEAKTS